MQSKASDVGAPNFLDKFKALARTVLDDELLVYREYKSIFGKSIDFSSPRTFNEKIQLQKLYNHLPEMTILADKYKARDFISQRGYGYILNGLIAVYHDPNEIEFEQLPDQFVIKCNHSWAANIICKDKRSLDYEATICQLEEWLEVDHYRKHREWAYKNIEPAITIEEYLPGDLKDFKFFCFGGEPVYVEVDADRASSRTLDLYNLSWERLPCKKGSKANSKNVEIKPVFFDEMLAIAKNLSTGFNFCRVDFLVDGKSFYFGEMTFYPGGGLSGFEPESYDYEFGKRFDVSKLHVPFSSKCKIALIKLMDRMGRV